jgi:hypothetical protein
MQNEPVSDPFYTDFQNLFQQRVQVGTRTQRMAGTGGQLLLIKPLSFMQLRSEFTAFPIKDFRNSMKEKLGS